MRIPALNEYLMALQEDPDLFFTGPDGPDEWVRRACQLWVVEERIWDSISQGFHHGSGFGVTERALNLLSRGLTDQQVMALYLHFREDYAEREWETQLRAEFQRVFPNQSEVLPTFFNEEEVQERRLPSLPEGTSFEDDIPF